MVPASLQGFAVLFSEFTLKTTQTSKQDICRETRWKKESERFGKQIFFAVDTMGSRRDAKYCLCKSTTKLAWFLHHVRQRFCSDEQFMAMRFLLDRVLGTALNR